MADSDLLSQFHAVPTKSKYGFSFEVPHLMQTDWIASWDKQHPLLDIGCGYSFNSRAAACQGAKVIATDISEKVLETQVQNPENSGIEYQVLRLPDRVPFPDQSISGILCAEVLHFLRHHEVIAAAWELHRILIPGGQLFITCVSEEIRVFEPVGLHAGRKQQRQQSPLYLHGVDNVFELLDKLVEQQPDDHERLAFIESYKSQLSNCFMNYFSAEQLVMVFQRLGFEVLTAEVGAADHYPVWVHGDRDQVRLMVRKPRDDRLLTSDEA